MFAKKTNILVLLVVIMLFTGACARKHREQIVIKGSTTVLPIAQKASESFMDMNDEIDISLSGTGSGDGIKSIIEGSCDIANSSREMKDKEKQEAEASGKKIKEITVAYDMICPVVHPSNPVKDLSMEQLRQIFSGQIVNWKELGGEDAEIVIISRDTSSGTYEYWQETVMKKDTKVSPEALLMASNGAVATYLSENKNAIGYVGHGYLNSTIKSLSVGNIEPTIENGKNGSYPIFRGLYMIIDEEKASRSTLEFIDYILSSEGQALAQDAGYIPLS